MLILRTEAIVGQAKSRLQPNHLMELSRVLIEESVSCGVTHMRAFVGVDEVVGLKSLDAGLPLKR
jgi:cytosine/adenosine deaminase-related metal-dependent hydrolase